MPIAINYSSFKVFGKNIRLFFGEIIAKENIDYNDTHGNAIRQFNESLKLQLSRYVFEIVNDDKEKLKEKFYIQQSGLKKVVLFVPAVLGFLIHAPLYYFAKWLGDIVNKETEHHDSKMVGLLFILYPVFLLLICGLVFYFSRSWLSLLVLLLLPFTAWSFVQLKKQLD